MDNYGSLFGWVAMVLAITAGIFFGFFFIDLAGFMNN